MRPRVLTVTAFGPYAGTEVIDFRRLHGKDLLLIEGPIGAGKTAILDALTFALYGSVPGARDDARGELKSAWADPQLRCEARLEFELGDKVYLAVRSPAQTRAKKRGGGLTAERAEARLFVLDGATPIPLCPPKVNDVDAEVTRLLGLDAEQFKQVLLLPQGEFRKLLLASSVDKEKLLEQLFGTEVYKQAAEILAAEKLRLERRIGELERARSDVLAARGVMTVDGLDTALASLREQVGTAGGAAGEARRVAAGARAAAAQAEARARLFDERERLRDEAKKLEHRAAAVTALRRMCAAIDVALPLAPALAAADSAAATATGSAAAAVRRAEARKQGDDELARAAVAAEAAPGLRAEAETLAAEEVRLAALAELAGELVGAASGLVELEGEVTHAAQRARGLDEAIATAERELRELETRLAEAQAAALEEAALVVGVDRAQTKARARAALALEEVASAQLAGGAVGIAEERARVAARRAAAAEELERSRASREQGLAAELAAHLVDGAACPVCGSPDHPAPAAGADLDAADAAREAIRLLAEEIAALDGELTTLDRRAAEDGAAARGHGVRASELRELLGDDAERPAEELVAAARVLAEKVRAARRAMGQRTGLAGARDRTQEQLGRLRGERALAGEAQGVAERNLAVARARVEDMRARVVDGTELAAPDAQRLASAIAVKRAQLGRRRAKVLESATTLETRLARAREAAAAESKLAEEAQRQSDEARLVAAEAQAELARVLRAAGITDAAALRRVLTDAPRREAARVDIEAWEAARVAVSARLQALEGELGDATRPDVAALAAAAAATEDEAARLATEVGATRAALHEAERARVRAAELGEELDGLQARLATFAHVARVAAGDNPMRMSLARFVLAQRIDEVAVAASERLLRLSRGRYLLRRSDDVRHAARGSGLDLVVEDRMTGVDRSVQTLSNGEQFLASLSLAMGLADTVQAHAGGVRLDSLFIDEGFGSLDDEALDLVIRVLEDLRAGGRLVGIITHVAELRERLTTRISVRKGARGSTTQLVV